MSFEGMDDCVFEYVVNDKKPEPIRLTAQYIIRWEDRRFMDCGHEAKQAMYHRIKNALTRQLAEGLAEKLNLFSMEKMDMRREIVEVSIVLNDWNAYDRWLSKGVSQGRRQEQIRQELARPYGLDEVYE